MSFETKRSLEIEMESARALLEQYRVAWDNNKTVANEKLLDEQRKYVGQIAYEIQRWNMHEKLIENGYEFDNDDEDIVIEYTSAWSTDLLEVAEAMGNKDLRCISFDEYVETYVVDDYVCRAGEQGVEILREFQRWLSIDDFKEFVRDHYTNDEENIVENFDDDYIIIMNY